MSRKTVPPFKAINQSVLSSSFVGAETVAPHKDRVFYTVDFSGTLVGSVIIEVWDNQSWKTLNFGLPILITAITGEHQILINLATFAKVRPSFIYTSGSGSLIVTLQASTEGS